MNLRHWVLLVVSALTVVACTNDSPIGAAPSAPTSSIEVSSDRSIDVSYSAGTIELSFARLGQPFRGMYARVLRWSNDSWLFFGYLRTQDANTVGDLIVAAEDSVELLDGANTDPAPDRYSAPALPTGRYLICTTLVEPENHNKVCGELSID